MRSIRLSLVLSFLALLAAALGVIGVLVNRTMQQTLQENNERTRELLRALHDSRAREVDAEFEKHILQRAVMFARLARRLSGTALLNESWPGLGTVAAIEPRASFLLPLVRLPRDHELARTLRPISFIKIQFAEDLLARPAAGGDAHSSAHATEYFQVYNKDGVPTQRSDALPDGAFSLDPRFRETLELFTTHYDDVELSPDLRVRRVTLRVPVPGFHWDWNDVMRFGGRGPRGGPTPRPSLPPPSQRPQFRDAESFFIQFASETRVHDQLIKQYDAELQQDLEERDAESQATLVSLRRRFLAIGFLTFAATLVGGFWLVRLGLLPLQHLTAAVSQVSEKDFRLPLGSVSMPRELTPIVKRLTETLEQLRKAFEREKQAAADISHELRTPLSALLATTDVALKKERTTEEYRAALKDCRASGRQMNQLVERLLALARLDAGVDPLQRKDVEVNEVAEVCTAMIRPLAESKGLQLRYHDAPSVSVRTDPEKLHEVLSNLLHNAIEYNREHGSIDVRVVRDNGSVVLEVADTGIGIPPQHRERIFERFYRADPSRQADGLHAGLGLAITKSYVELMGGHISVESREGAGSTFRIELPAHEMTKSE